MARLRPGRANTARGAAHFLRETVGRVRYAGAKGQLTVRADSGCYTHAMVTVCRQMDVRYSITIRQHAQLRNLIEAIPETDWTPIPYWMEGAADVAEAEYTPFESKPDATPVRLIVRRVKPTPGSQLSLFATYSYHACITDQEGRDPGTGGRSRLAMGFWPRRDRECHPRPEVRRGAQPSPLGAFPRQRRLAGRPGHRPSPGSLDLTHRAGRGGGDYQDPPATLLLSGRTPHPQGAAPHTASPPGLALAKPVQLRPGETESPATTLLIAQRRLPRPLDCLTASQICARPVPACLLLPSAR